MMNEVERQPVMPIADIKKLGIGTGASLATSRCSRAASTSLACCSRSS